MNTYSTTGSTTPPINLNPSVNVKTIPLGNEPSAYFVTDANNLSTLNLSIPSLIPVVTSTISNQPPVTSPKSNYEILGLLYKGGQKVNLYLNLGYQFIQVYTASVLTTASTEKTKMKSQVTFPINVTIIKQPLNGTIFTTTIPATTQVIPFSISNFPYVAEFDNTGITKASTTAVSVETSIGGYFYNCIKIDDAYLEYDTIYNISASVPTLSNTDGFSADGKYKLTNLSTIVWNGEGYNSSVTNYQSNTSLVQ